MKDGVQIYTGVSHIPQTVDEGLIAAILEDFDIDLKAVTVDYENSDFENSLLVFVEHDNVKDAHLFNKIQNILEEKHGVKCKSVIILEKGTIGQYEGTSSISRFTLRHDYYARKFPARKWFPEVDCATWFP